jgi:hypothetical protein
MLGATIALVSVIANGIEMLVQQLQRLAPQPIERLFARIVDVAAENGVSGFAVVTLVLTNNLGDEHAWMAVRLFASRAPARLRICKR